MSIFMTGATGFVGKEILKDLLKEGHEVACLVRPGSEKKLNHLETSKLKIILGDITEPRTYIDRLDRCETVIHLVGIIREYPKKRVTYQKLHVEATRHLVQATLQKGIPRFFQMSALGARPRAKARYHQTKFQAEEIVRNSGLRYIIFQPSVIFGSQDQFINMLAEMVKWNPVTPLIGGGKGKMQPVAVEDISEGVVRLLNEKSSNNRTYTIGGPEILTFKEILGVIKNALGIKRPNVWVPTTLIKPVVKIMEQFSFFPLTFDQLIMLGEDNICDGSAYFQDTQIQPKSFREGIVPILGKGGKP